MLRSCDMQVLYKVLVFSGVVLAPIMGFAQTLYHDPAGSSWSVASYDDDGAIGDFDPVPWEFHDGGRMNAGNIWEGICKPKIGDDDAINCHLQTWPDNFTVVFLTSDRFVATKAGHLYRFGKRL
jgi:hypothetical protein